MLSNYFARFAKVETTLVKTTILKPFSIKRVSTQPILAKIVILVFTFSSSVLSAKSVDKQELKIIESINQDHQWANRLLQETVNVNSGTMNFDGVRKVGDILGKELNAIGFKTEWLEGASFNRAGHLLASYGNSGPKIMLIGHLDTVFAKGDSFQNFTTIDDSRVSGPGITDMKGGNVMIIWVMRALKDSGLLDNYRFRIIMTGDEELSGKPLSKSKKAIVDLAKWADIALGFEDGDGDIKTAVTARRGAINWNLAITGKAAHSSQIFREDIGYGAIYETSRILEAFREQLSKEENLTFNPGLLVAGTKVVHQPKDNSADAFGKNNVIAQTAKVTGDIRAQSPAQLTRVKAQMEKIVANGLPHTSAKIEFNKGYPPMAATSGNKQLLSLYSEVSQALGYGPVEAVNPLRAGAADISFAAGHVKMALDGLGLMGEGGHTKDEVADMTSFSKNAHKSALLIYRLGQKAY